ncbi:MAG: type II secretion system F family protein [Methylococcales bacterium]|nr:type II secretion system F family protein [Methylococcales bacterium]
MKNPKNQTLEQQAEFYLQLSRLDEAGLPAEQAFELIKVEDLKTQYKIQQLQRAINAGRSIAETGVKLGLFNPLDKALLNAGEASGCLGVVYIQLAESYSQQSTRNKKIKSKCYLPLAILVLALFIEPLPALIQSKITAFTYLVTTIGHLFKLALFLYISFNLSKWLTLGWLKFLGLGNMVYQLQLKLPLISSWLKARQINEFLTTLGLLLIAGMPILEAVPKAINNIKNPILKTQFEVILKSIQQGNSLTNAFILLDDINEQTIQLLIAGEQSGKLAESLLHRTKMEAEIINLQDDMLAEWIPRVFYIFIASWMAYSIINNYSSNALPL